MAKLSCICPVFFFLVSHLLLQSIFGAMSLLVDLYVQAAYRFGHAYDLSASKVTPIAQPIQNEATLFSYRVLELCGVRSTLAYTPYSIL